MESLEASMKKHNNSIDSSSSSSSSHGHALFASGFSFNATSTYSSHGHALSAYGFSFNSTSTYSFDEWLIDYGAYYRMAKDKTICSTLNECNTKQIFVGDDRSLRDVGFETVQVDNGHFNYVLYVPSLSYILLSVY
jgi:hypothetical protein